VNTFGRLLRVHLFGESHGPMVGVLLDGCPAGLPLAPGELEAELARRRAGAPGTTPRREADQPRVLSGLHQGRTTGAPLLIAFDHGDVDPAAYAGLERTPRPGHADLTARHKYAGCADPRGGGHFSGRLTVGLVAAGVLAKRLLLPARVEARLLEAGGQPDALAAAVDAAAAGDSVGGLLECRAGGLPVGLGEPFFDSVEGLLSHALFALGGVRGVEFGAGFAAARMRGSQCNDPILDPSGRTATNHAGGVNGGLTNGNELVFRVAVKPTSSIALPQQTVDLESGQPVELRVPGRHDACHALRLPVVVEAVTALVLADLLLIQRGLAHGAWT
jgi:chorismate synthase